MDSLIFYFNVAEGQGAMLFSGSAGDLKSSNFQKNSGVNGISICMSKSADLKISGSRFCDQRQRKRASSIAGTPADALKIDHCSFCQEQAHEIYAEGKTVVEESTFGEIESCPVLQIQELAVVPKGVRRPEDLKDVEDVDNEDEDDGEGRIGRPRRRRSIVTFELWLVACCVFGYVVKRYLGPVKRPGTLGSDEEILVGRGRAYDREDAPRNADASNQNHTGLDSQQPRFEDVEVPG
jgi:hypothetical protein